MKTLEELSAAYKESTTDKDRDVWTNRISHFLLNDRAARSMILTMLSKKGKLLDRLDDALQDVTILFVMKVLPTLRKPEAAWGAFKGTVNIVGHRLGSNFYDAERGAVVSLNTNAMSNDSNPENSGDTYSDNYSKNENYNSDDDRRNDELEFIENIMIDKAKESINEALIMSKMNGKNALSWLPTLTKKAERKRTLPSLEEMPRIVGPQTRSKAFKSTPQVPESNAYKRLNEIRERTGLSVDGFAEALGIGVPRLRSYLNRKSHVNPEVLNAAEHWYKSHGKVQEKRLKKLKSIPLSELIEQWKEATNASSYASLAIIIDISIATMSRWRQPGSKPMHDSRLLDADSRVSRHIRSTSLREDKT